MVKQITDLDDTIQTSYSKDYLVGTMNLIRLVFVQMNEINDLDIFDQIDAYMRTSDVRAGMDRGLWKELMKGWKQVYNSIDQSGIQPGKKSDSVMLHWLADIYTYWQWRYCISSKQISEACNARMLAQLYYPLHETSIQNACEKLQIRFFGKDKP